MSWKAGVFWLFWIVLITVCVWKFNLIVSATQDVLSKYLPAKPEAPIEEDEDELSDIIPPLEELPTPYMNTSNDDFDPTFEDVEE
ncbi:MAG: hypothetical protein Q4G03_01530 [Planctomycetia bacterium]|nr:hypothetical protein [Planctomycetia bacterium]